jgi:uracil-DNA glycosylase
MAAAAVHGVYPFGSQLRAVVQDDRSRKRIFVLGVYASAVHAKWIGPDGRVLIRALAVASEPVIFWDGHDAAKAVAAVNVPAAAGRLIPAEAALNGPSGRSLDADYLAPLGSSRRDAWLCDMVPHTCLNPSQAAAIAREYEPRRHRLGLPAVALPPVPRVFADESRRAEILAEVDEARPDVLVLLGDKPIKDFLLALDRRWKKLADFGTTSGEYGRLRQIEIRSRRLNVLPLAHPRQVSRLGTHSSVWQQLHARWTTETAWHLLG